METLFRMKLVKDGGLFGICKIQDLGSEDIYKEMHLANGIIEAGEISKDEIVEEAIIMIANAKGNGLLYTIEECIPAFSFLEEIDIDRLKKIFTNPNDLHV